MRIPEDPTRDPSSEALDDHDVDESEESFGRFTEREIDHADRLHDELRDRQWEEARRVRENSSPKQIPSTTSILPSKSL